MLPPSAALAVGTARSIYAAIGMELEWRSYDVFAGRAVVRWWVKASLVTWRLLAAACALPRALLTPFRAAPLRRALGTSDVIRI
jgi:hypothetical protein